MTLKRFVALVLVFGLFAIGGISARAGEYPDKPIRMIVGFTPGGGADSLARVISDRLSNKFNIPIVIDNRPGAGSAIGTGIAAKAAADGYTLLFATASLTINPNLYSHVSYDPIKDFAPIAEVALSPLAVVVGPSLPVHSLKDLLALAKSKKLNYSTGGIGSMGHLAGELLKSMTGAQIQHVPYKGLAPALADLLGGRVEITMSSLASANALLKSGQLRALAVSTSKRTPFLPDIPTIAESGVEGYDIAQWFGVLAPSGTPKQTVEKLNAALSAFLAKPDTALLERYTALGSIPLMTSPEEFQSFIKTNLAFWKKTVRLANAKVE